MIFFKKIFDIINIIDLGGIYMDFRSNLLVTNAIYDWFKDTLCKGNELLATVVLVGIAVIFIVLLVVIIASIAKNKKKKSSKKEETLIKNDVSNNVLEEPMCSSSSSEEVKSVEKEEKKVENTKEEIKEERKEQMVEKKESAEKKPTSKNKKSPVEKVEPVKAAEPVATEEVMTETMLLRAKGKYEIFPINDVFMYRLKASNGEILVTSEIYKSTKGATAAVETIKKSVETGTITISKDKHNLYQFKLFAQNKRLLAVSANYPTEMRCQSAAESFKKFALVSPVVILEEDPDHLMEKIEINEREDKNGGKVIVEFDRTYSFKLLANNGVVICSSEEYKTKVGVLNGIDSLKEAINSGTFYVIKDKRDMYQFKLYSTSGRVVVYGETYKNKAQAISAANSVLSFMNKAEIIDKTIQEEVK